MQDVQSQFVFNWLEVAVVVQKLVTLLNAEGGNEAVDCFAYREPKALQCTEVPRRCCGETRS